MQTNPFAEPEVQRARLREAVSNNLGIKIAPAFREMFLPARYKVYYGGRGSGKSWQAARILVMLAHTRFVKDEITGLMRGLRILCCRELQNSMADSVHKLLVDQIMALGLIAWFKVTDDRIISTVTGAEFLFKGLWRHAAEIKSMEGIDICWVEEAQRVSKASWKYLIPTIRKRGSEIWVTFNPENEDDPTYQRFVINAHQLKNKLGQSIAIVRKVNWDQNPYFTQELDQERMYDLRTDPEAYEHIWNGECASLSDAIILRRKVRPDMFEQPSHIKRLFFGADFGFAVDPATLVRGWIDDRKLFISHEAWRLGVEINEYADFYDTVPDSRAWPIKADGARPEVISYIKREGFNIDAAEKWPGSVEDGIAHLRGFDEIVVHERCEHWLQESRLYKYKVDPKTQDVLPIVVDKHNHCIDATRYALDGYIQRRSPDGRPLGVWAKLAQ